MGQKQMYLLIFCWVCFCPMAIYSPYFYPYPIIYRWDDVTVAPWVASRTTLTMSLRYLIFYVQYLIDTKIFNFQSVVLSEYLLGWLVVLIQAQGKRDVFWFHLPIQAQLQIERWSKGLTWHDYRVHQEPVYCCCFASTLQ